MKLHKQTKISSSQVKLQPYNVSPMPPRHAIHGIWQNTQVSIINIGWLGRGGHFDHAHGRKTCKAGLTSAKLKQSVAKFSPRTESCIVSKMSV